MPTLGQRKCAHCKLFFKPDPRQRKVQRFCASPACRKVSKATSQERWLAKPENQDLWRGAENVQRVREWRACNPGYWRRVKNDSGVALQETMTAQVAQPSERNVGRGRGALQETWREQPPLVLGLIAHLTGVALQDDMAGMTRRLIARGEALLGCSHP